MTNSFPAFQLLQSAFQSFNSFLERDIDAQRTYKAYPGTGNVECVVIDVVADGMKLTPKSPTQTRGRGQNSTNGEKGKEELQFS
jgi:hypothetical protein